MARVRSDRARKKGEAEMRVGLDSLRNGQLTYPWVCREYLSLCADPSPVEVVNAVHAMIHTSKKASGDDWWKAAVAAITAGACLLRTAKGL